MKFTPQQFEELATVHKRAIQWMHGAVNGICSVENKRGVHLSYEAFMENFGDDYTSEPFYNDNECVVGVHYSKEHDLTLFCLIKDPVTAQQYLEAKEKKKTMSGCNEADPCLYLQWDEGKQPECSKFREMLTCVNGRVERSDKCIPYMMGIGEQW